MGWKLTANTRDDWLSPALSGAETTAVSDAQVVFIDGPAMARYMMVGKTTRSPQSVASSVWRMVPQEAKTVFIGFDDPRLGDPCGLRAEVAVARSRMCKVTALSDSIATSITPCSLPTLPDGTLATWDQQLASTVGKKAAFLVVFEALQRLVIADSNDACPQCVTLTPPFGGKDGKQKSWHYPFGRRGPFADVLEARPSGEAEAQIAHCAKSLVESALQQESPVPKWAWISIDTDVFIQALGFPPINGTLVVGRGYAYNQIVYASETAAAKAAQIQSQSGSSKRRKIAPKKVWRHYCLNAFAERVLCGHSAARFARAQLIMLCAAGVDYCTGLGRYGWTAKRLLSTLKDNSSHLIVCVENNMLVDMIAFRAVLCATRRNKRFDAEVRAFVQELSRIMYCMRYYSWGLPDQVTYASDEIHSLEAATISDWLVSSSPSQSWLVPIGARRCGIDGPERAAEPLRRYNVFTD